APPPPPPTAPISSDWRDIPVTPGGWAYAAEPGATIARFGAAGAPLFSVRCDLAQRSVTLAREGASSAAAPLIDITTSAGRQSFAAQSLSSRMAVAAAIPARDGFLDKMAFSRGRFLVAVTGMPRLAIPAWPEFVRVVEDCRG
ncbi:MAG: hypothetical protein JWM75_2552, partial [Sphingomonas bacterium]|nr:hypothetical protein [Sphingomonas bacterium]